MGASTQIAKANAKALELIDSLPDRTAKVGARGNADKGVIAKNIAQRLIETGKVRVVTGGRITTDLEPRDKGTGDQPVVPDGGDGEMTPEAKAEYAKRVANQPGNLHDKIEAATSKIKADKKAAAPKVNGRKAKADASPYSTSTPTGKVKRHGKSRRTGTMTQIVDLLAKGGPEEAGKVMGQPTYDLVGSGRFAVQCIDHKQTMAVPNMTEGKPLQARTDQFCQECRKIVNTQAAQAS
jgi:hypothetical protein